MENDHHKSISLRRVTRTIKVEDLRLVILRRKLMATYRLDIRAVVTRKDLASIVDQTQEVSIHQAAISIRSIVTQGHEQVPRSHLNMAKQMRWQLLQTALLQRSTLLRCTLMNSQDMEIITRVISRELVAHRILRCLKKEQITLPRTQTHL